MAQMNQNQYHFVSAEKDIDYLRILREAPKGTPFILVEERTKNGNKILFSTLFVSNSILSNPKLSERVLLGEKISKSWGSDGSTDGYGKDFTIKDYRYVFMKGKIEGAVKQKLLALQSALSYKNRKTIVTYL